MGPRQGVAVIAALAALGACGSPSDGGRSGTPGLVAGPDPSHAPSQIAVASRLRVGRNARVSVSVATVWRTPRSPRPVDAPALAHPARIRRWLGRMTLDERRDLNGRADTQALMGDRVRVVGLRRGWARVRVAGQPNPDDPGNYEGWVPRRQLTASAPLRTPTMVTVVGRTAWLRGDDAAGRRITRISFATRLPYLGTAGRFTRVQTPGGATRRILSAAVVSQPAGDPALPPTRRSVARTATAFSGLAYLWAGRSGFGLDCSGLTSLVYRAHGVVIPRDAAPQSRSGAFVAARRWRRGDLLFYASGGVVHHVAMYVGEGQMVHAPRTGSEVQVVPVTLSGYAGARRYLN
jgi:gamma-D-glutamyl-L-lysine dipeptidyl-peptidase